MSVGSGKKNIRWAAGGEGKKRLRILGWRRVLCVAAQGREKGGTQRRGTDSVYKRGKEKEL